MPQPPRAWSRVQNSCSLNTDSTSLLPLGQKMEMLNKGNVLQYKANSSNLTKAQKYSKIAKGQWVNRNTTWATQSSRGYTNPNTDGLKRAGNVVNIAIDPITGAILGPTTAPITCPQTNTIINEGLPSSQNDSINNPEVPPPVPPTPASEGFPEIIPESVVEPIVIPDGGTLICSVQENPCTGETKSSISQQQCNPTTDSDVPGPIELLCWNDGTPTWYPRQRYVMTNSANKWPDNATLFSAVKPSAPIITSVSSIDNIVTLVWIQSEFCLPVSRFDIYQNDIFIKSVPSSTFTTNIEVEFCNTYEYFIIAVTNGSTIFSEPSNVVNITIPILTPYMIIDGTYTQSSDGIYNTILTFTTSASIIFNISVPIDYVVTGGGAGGYKGYTGGTAGGDGGNGGSGGQVVSSNFTSTIATVYSLTIGNGGVGSSGSGGSSGGNGGNSSISGVVTALGGTNPGNGGAGGTGSSGSGTPGVIGSNGTLGYGGGGGGGGGGAGSIIGSDAAGGGGSGSSVGGVGGTGGTKYEVDGNPGTTALANTGGGGGGGGGGGQKGGGPSDVPGIGGNGGNGGSGIIILKFNAPLC